MSEDDEFLISVTRAELGMILGALFVAAGAAEREGEKGMAAKIMALANDLGAEYERQRKYVARP